MAKGKKTKKAKTKETKPGRKLLVGAISAIRIFIDEKLPEDTVELRDGYGRLLVRVEDVRRIDMPRSRKLEQRLRQLGLFAGSE